MAKDENLKFKVGNGLIQLVTFTMILMLFCGGCNNELNNDTSMLESGPDVDFMSVPPNFAYESIEAAGGLDAWAKVTKLPFDCVVSVYQDDGSPYLTEQSCEIYPWSKSVRISSQEPEGIFTWQLSRGKFIVLQGGKLNSYLTDINTSKHFTELLLNLVTAPVRFADASSIFTRETDSVRLQGKWYHPVAVKAQESNADQNVPDMVFYQDRTSSLVDMILCRCSDDNHYLMARGYDYFEIEEKGVSIPAKIEIFTADVKGNTQQRLFTVDFSLAE